MTVFTGSLTVLLACHHRAYLDVNTTTYEKIPVAWLIWLCRWALVLQHPDELDAIGSHGGRDGGWHRAMERVASVAFAKVPAGGQNGRDQKSGQAADRVAPHIFGKCRLRTSPAIAEGNIVTKTWTP